MIAWKQKSKLQSWDGDRPWRATGISVIKILTPGPGSAPKKTWYGSALPHRGL